MQPLNFFPNGFPIPTDLKFSDKPDEICKYLIDHSEELAKYILKASEDSAWRKEKEHQNLLIKITSEAANAPLPHPIALQILQVKEKLDLPLENPLFEMEQIQCENGGRVEVNKLALKSLSPVLNEMVGSSFFMRGVGCNILQKQVAILLKKIAEGNEIDFSTFSGEIIYEFLISLKGFDLDLTILKNTYPQIFKNGQINQNNVLGLLEYGYLCKDFDLTKACFKFLNTCFPHVKFNTEPHPVKEDIIQTTIQIAPGVPDDEIEELIPLFEFLRENEKSGGHKVHCHFLPPKRWLPLQYCIDKGFFFEGIYGNAYFKFRELPFDQLCDFIKQDLPLLKEPLTKKNLLKLQNSKMAGVQNLLTQFIHRINTQKILVELLCSDFSTVNQLLFSLSGESPLLFQRTSENEISVAIQTACQEELLLHSLTAFRELSNDKQIHWCMANEAIKARMLNQGPDEKKAFNELLGKESQEEGSFSPHCAPQVSFIRKGKTLLIDLGGERDKNCLNLITHLEKLKETCRSETFNIELKTENNGFISQLFAPIRTQTFENGSWKDYLEEKPINFDLFIDFLKNDLPLLIKTVDLETAKKIIRSPSLLIPEKKEEIALFLYEKFIAESPFPQAEINHGYILKLYSFFKRSDYLIYKKYLSSLLEKINEIDCTGALSLKTEYVFKLAKLCPNVREISLLYCKNFKEKEIFQLRQICKNLKTLTVSESEKNEMNGIKRKLLEEQLEKRGFNLYCYPYQVEELKEFKQKETALKERLKQREKLEKK